MLGKSPAPAAPAAATAVAPEASPPSPDAAAGKAGLMGNSFMQDEMCGFEDEQEESSLLEGVEAGGPAVDELELDQVAADAGVGPEGTDAAKAGGKAEDPKMGFFEGMYKKLTKWHFEGREEKNGKPPDYDELTKPGSEWKLLPQAMSVFHDNGVGKPELKFVHPDGREAVIDGDTHEPVTDAKYMPTYNYVNPMPMDEIKGPTDLVKFAGKNIGHFLTDVVPYAIGGNVRGEN
jgi:hypothetical protein